MRELESDHDSDRPANAASAPLALLESARAAKLELRDILPAIGVVWAAADTALEFSRELNATRRMIIAPSAAESLSVAHRWQMFEHDWLPLAATFLVALGCLVGVCTFVARSVGGPTQSLLRRIGIVVMAGAVLWLILGIVECRAMVDALEHAESIESAARTSTAATDVLR